jgi:hypothetical protein
MSMTAASRGLVGFLDALRPDGTVVGWARDPKDPATRPLIRLLRGVEVLAEVEATIAREDGNPGFRLVPPVALTPEDFLEGRVRVRAVAPGRQAATTLAMTPRMREVLEERAGWEPTVAPRAAAPDPTRPATPPRAAPPSPPPPSPPAPSPPPASPPPPSPPRVSPPPAPPPAPPSRSPAAAPPPATAPAPRPEIPAPHAAPDAPPLRAMHAMALALHRAGIPVLHALIPPRGAVVRRGQAEPNAHPALALEQQAAAWPLLAQDWLPLRQALARDAQPMALWRHDGQQLTVEGQMVLLRLLLSALRLRHPAMASALIRAEAIIARADLACLPRREIGEASGPSFLGVMARETEPALTERIFADLPPPVPIAPAATGVEAWRNMAAPLPWRVVVLTVPGLGGSTGPALIGWWLRRLAAECVLSEALEIAPPGALVDAAPNLVLTLAPA